jgi:UDP-glucose 4-epimerase
VNTQTLAALSSPDAVFHCAGSGSVSFSLAEPAQDFARTVGTTLDVLEFLRRRAPQAVLVIPSSAAVYGAVRNVPISPDGPFNPVSPYGVHKKLAEDLCRSYARHFNVRVAIVRLFSVYGTGLRKQLLWDACNKLASGNGRFGGHGGEIRDWLHIEDAARLLIAAAHHASPGCPAVNGGSGKGVAVRDMLTDLLAALASSVRLEFTGTARPGDPDIYVADIAGAKAWGWSPREDRIDALRTYARWFTDGAK